MDQKLKERLFGAVIILSVLIIVLPVLFKPPPPDALGALYPEDSLHEQKVQNSIALALDNHLLKEKPAKPVMPMSMPLVRKPIKPCTLVNGKAWVLRIGIFSHPQNAKSLVEKLHAKGYPAYAKCDTSKELSITRVFVGPKKTEADIKTIRADLKKELNIEGLVLFIKTPELGVG